MSILIRSATPPQLLGVHWAQSAPDIYLGDGGPMMPAPPVGAVVIAQDGLVLDLPEYLAICPLGNKDGQATDTLRYHHFMGEEPRLAGDPQAEDPIERRYPADNLPFEIDIRHHYFNTPATPSSTGWGFRAEIVGGAASRDPSARSTGAYTDDTFATWIWPQVGAFIQGPSAWQVDDQGQPLTVWYQDSWDGYRRPAKETYYVALLYGPTMEGKAVLPVDRENVVYQFWEHDQGYVPPPTATWVDTGATVTALYGTAYNLSAVLTLAVGQPIRLGENPANETTFNGYWPTPGSPSTTITVSPDKRVPIGTKVYKWA